LKGLEDIISVDVVHWHMQELGWPFKEGYEDSLYGSKYIREIYFKAQPDYSGRFTVPVLWDKKTQTVGKFEWKKTPPILWKRHPRPWEHGCPF